MAFHRLKMSQSQKYQRSEYYICPAVGILNYSPMEQRNANLEANQIDNKKIQMRWTTTGGAGGHILSPLVVAHRIFVIGTVVT